MFKKAHQGWLIFDPVDEYVRTRSGMKIPMFTNLLNGDERLDLLYTDVDEIIDTVLVLSNLIAEVYIYPDTLAQLPEMDMIPPPIPRFKVGDRVKKARRFSDTIYCRYGGNAIQFPIGTDAVVTRVVYVRSIRSYIVDASASLEGGDVNWEFDESELDLATP